MWDFGKNSSMRPIHEIMECVKKETAYDKNGLVAMLPFLRASSDGTHRLVIPLLEKMALWEGEKACHIIIRKILYLDVATGEVIAQEDAAKFFIQYAFGGSLVKPVPIFRSGVDRSLVEEYRSRQFALIEKVRQEICENGECLQDTYMDYLRYALYFTSDEFAATLLYLSRTYSTDISMALECGTCHKKVIRDVQGYQEGQLILLDCPYCQRPIHAKYHKSGRCIVYNERYMYQERNRFLEKPMAVAQDVSVREDIFETDSVFSVCEPLEGERLCQRQQEGAAALKVGLPVCQNDAVGEEHKEKDNPVEGEIPGDESEVRGEPVGETVRDVPCPQKAEDVEKWPDISCQEAKVIGLSQIKRFFKVIRTIAFSDGGISPAPVFALLGDKGCGINTSIRYLSGYQEKEILYMDLSSINEECLHVNYRCVVVCLQAEDKVPVWMPAALSRLNRHTTVFFVGAREVKLPEELSAQVVYKISYKSYTVDELNKLFMSRMVAYGLHVRLTKEQQTQLFKNKNALDVKRLCQQIYFKHRLALCEGKGSEDALPEEVIAREIRSALGKGEQRADNG